MLTSFFKRFSSPKSTGGFASTLLPQPSAEMLRLLPRSFDSLEVWLLVFCGVYGLLVSTFILPGAGELKLMCIGFMLLAVAKRFKPARTKTQWLWGAMAALLLSALIYLDPNSGGSSGPFLFLMILLAMGYPLLMEPPAASIFGLAVVLIYYLSISRHSYTISRDLMLLRGGLLAGICFLSARYGAVLRRSEEIMDAMRRDSQSLAYNEHGLAYYGGQLIRSCKLGNSPCTMVLLRMPMDWILDVMSDMGPVLQKNVHTLALQDIAAQISQSAPQGSLLARTSELDWVLVVPGMNSNDAVGHLVSRFGRPLQIPFGLKDDEWFVAVSPCAVQVNDEYHSVARLLVRAQQVWERGFNTGVV